MTIEQEAARFERERADKVADQLRAALLTIATAGVGAGYSLSDKMPRSLWGAGILCFLLGVMCVLKSWFLVKRRSIKRQYHAEADLPAPTFKWWERSAPWDEAAAILLIVGAAAFALGLAFARSSLSPN
jgi:hypothetical protein